MLVVTITSWPKRITNCASVIRSILNNTRIPDRVYLNLSIEEFPNKESDLPEELNLILESENSFIINWVEGPNTKTMKKVLPILQYLDDEDFIINFDDDALMPSDFIESRVKEFETFNQPITSANNPQWHLVKPLNIGVSGSGSIFKKKMLKHWDQLVTDKVIETYNDDNLYALLAYLNGYLYKPTINCSSHSGVSKTKLKKYNDNDGLGKTHGYMNDQTSYDRLNEEFRHLYGREIKDSFGFFKTDHIDFVIPGVISNKNAFSVASTIGKRLEIEYVIKSIRMFCNGAGRIFVACPDPMPDAIKDKVVGIKCDDPYTHIKDANQLFKMKTVIEQVTDLSDNYVFASDDQVVIRSCSIDDLYPRVLSDLTNRQILEPQRSDYKDEGSYKWDLAMKHTLEKFPTRAYKYQPHAWSIWNKLKLLELGNTYDIEHDDGIISHTLYYNFINEPKRLNKDHQNLNGPERTKKFLESKKKPLIVSGFDAGFEIDAFRDFLEDTFFNNKELPNTISESDKSEQSFKIIKRDSTQINSRKFYHIGHAHSG